MDTVLSSEAAMNALLCYHRRYVCLAIRHPSFGENTALPHSRVILLMRVVDAWHSWLIKILHYPEHSGRSRPPSYLLMEPRICSALWKATLTHQLSMFLPKSLAPWSMTSDRDCQGGAAVRAYCRNPGLYPEDDVFTNSWEQYVLHTCGMKSLL